MPRYAAKIDQNQPEIVTVLRQIGCSVFVASHIGGGFSDLVVGRNHRTLLLEVKNGLLAPSRRNLTPDQQFFAGMWRGHYAVVKSIDEAIDVVTEGTIR